MHRVLSRLAGVLALAGVAVLTPAAPASAAAPLEYSVDGVTWSATPPASLFPSMTVVPGDSETVTLYLRSTRGVDSVLTLVLRDATASDPIFESGLALEGNDDTGAGLPLTAFARIADCTAAIPPRTVAPGEVVPVTFDLAMSSALRAEQAQNAWLRFELVIGLADPGAPRDAVGCPIGSVIPGVPPGAGSGGGAAGSVAVTGSDVAPRTAVVAVAVLAAGGILLLVARRRRREATA
jgi:hypothetical protein